MPLQIVAHRRVTTDAAENTLEAFRAAQLLGADAIELDVRLSADGIAVVYHYAYLEALTDGSGPVWQRSLAELRSLWVGDRADTRIPTLEEVLQEFAPTSLGLTGRAISSRLRSMVLMKRELDRVSGCASG